MGKNVVSFCLAYLRWPFLLARLIVENSWPDRN